MKSNSLAVLALIAITSSLAACGLNSANKKTSELETSDVLGRKKLTVSAVIVNESASPIEVVFLNNGPHGGACDSKNFVSKQAKALDTTTLTETWYCTMDQWFYIEVRHPKGVVKVKGMEANLRCNDEGCVQAGNLSQKIELNSSDAKLLADALGVDASLSRTYDHLVFPSAAALTMDVSASRPAGQPVTYNASLILDASKARPEVGDQFQQGSSNTIVYNFSAGADTLYEFIKHDAKKVVYASAQDYFMFKEVNGEKFTLNCSMYNTSNKYTCTLFVKK